MKLLLICPESDQSLGLFSDLYGNQSVIVKYVNLKKKCFRWIRKGIYTLRYLTGLNLSVPSCIFDYDIKQYLRFGVERIIVRSNVLEYIPITYFQSLRNKGYKCEVLLLDSMNAGSYTIKLTRKYLLPGYWDKITTFDPVDAKQYGFSFNGFHYYSKKNIEFNNSRKSYDLYYIGSTKGNRSSIVNGIFKFLDSKNVHCRFDMLVSNIDQNKIFDEKIQCFRKSIPYSDVLKKVNESNCVLEILQENQSGPSLRYFEAIVYNKKLLTNNTHIVNFPFYNPRYMKIFASTNDIDINWLIQDMTVDYKYKDDFSPIHILDE